jgi:hypothetical protein
MLRVGFEPTIPVSERAKMVHALALAATVIGALHTYSRENRKIHNIPVTSFWTPLCRKSNRGALSSLTNR